MIVNCSLSSVYFYFFFDYLVLAHFSNLLLAMFLSITVECARFCIYIFFVSTESSFSGTLGIEVTTSLVITTP